MSAGSIGRVVRSVSVIGTSGRSSAGSSAASAMQSPRLAPAAPFVPLFARPIVVPRRRACRFRLAALAQQIARTPDERQPAVQTGGLLDVASAVDHNPIRPQPARGRFLRPDFPVVGAVVTFAA